MASKKETVSLLKQSRKYFAIPVALLVIIIITVTGLLIAYAYSNEKGFLIALGIVSFFFASGLGVLIYFLYRLLDKNYYQNLYLKTVNNLKKLNRDEADLDSYGNTSFEEIKTLDELTTQIKDKYSYGRLIPVNPSYDALSLEYVDKEKGLLDYESLRKNIANIIGVSQCFRNVLIEVYFDLKKEVLTDENKDEILNLYRETFKDYKNPLFAFSTGGKSLIIYLPVIDSISKIKEQLLLSINYASISVRTVRGSEIAHPRFNIVIYPYSSEEYLFSDLEYVRRMKEVFNIYIPDRAKSKLDSHPIITTAMNLNYMSKAMTLVANINYNSKDNAANIEILKEIFSDVSRYMAADCAGIIYTDPATMTHKILFQIENSKIFDEKELLSDSFMNAFKECADPDGSLYFSSRSTIPIKLGRELDYYDVTSGYYHLIRDDKNEVLGIIFFLNCKDKNLYLDSYMRESLFLISTRITHYFSTVKMLDYIDMKEAEAEHILALDNKHSLYRVDDQMNLTYLSSYIKKLFPSAKVGQPCYKELFGLDKMCPDCPMKAFKKKSATIKNKHFEMSLTLNDRKTHERAILLTAVDNDALKTDYFDNNLLCYSRYSFINLMKNEYEQSARGYVLLLCLDNYNDFVSNQGSEGFAFATRCLIRNIKNKLKTQDVYLYNPSTLVIHFPNAGHIEVIDKCETIYNLSKEHYFDDNSIDTFNITYLPIGYPRGYPDANDFMRHISDVYTSDKFERNKDFIYFASYPIARSASRREHIKDIINKEFFGLSPQSLSLQPFVKASEGKIFGAEVLLRITDLYSNAPLSPIEVTRIALEENMTHVLTESIVNFLGNLYAEYGNSILKNNRFSRFAINVDNTYFDDANFVKTVADLMKDNKLPKYYISFEIPEDIIGDNLGKIKQFSKILEDYSIYLSCDRFKNNIISIERLHEYGFNEVKIARDLIINIDKDRDKLENIRNIVAECKKYGLTVSCVGVESQAQFNILKEIDPDMLIQGYYLYKPLSRSDFITSLMSFE